MPKNRKYFPHKSIIHVTARAQEGLPFVPSDVLNLITWGILASASSKYDVHICHLVFMGNHFHMVLVVSNPAHVKDFVGYVKAEIAHAVNRLLGRRKRTVWEEGYGSTVLLTVQEVEKCIRYIYLNPVTADLETSIKNYPGVSSWQMFLSGTTEAEHPKIRRSAIKPLEHTALSQRSQRRLRDQYLDLKSKKHSFKLEPCAWLACFPAVTKSEQEIKSRLLHDIEQEEQELAKTRREKGRGVIGAVALKQQCMRRHFTPKKFTPRMICLSEDIELRKRYIAHYRMLCERARRIYQQWKLGDLSQQMPPGLYPPRVPVLSSALPI